jgi:hypothetical protein
MKLTAQLHHPDPTLEMFGAIGLLPLSAGLNSVVIN